MLSLFVGLILGKELIYFDTVKSEYENHTKILFVAKMLNSVTISQSHYQQLLSFVHVCTYVRGTCIV